MSSTDDLQIERAHRKVAELIEQMTNQYRSLLNTLQR
jgi:hypothetical protein